MSADRSIDTLECVSLWGIGFGDIELGGLVDVLGRSRHLTELILSNNGIGRNGCTSLARLLKKNSSLKALNLNFNPITDECAAILAEGLANNTELNWLDLGENKIMTRLGWLSFLKLVCDSTSINGVLGSNYTLKSFRNEKTSGSLASTLNYVIPTLKVADFKLLCASLHQNQTNDKLRSARQKIVWSHVRGDLNIGDSSIPNGAMPHIIAWFGDDKADIKLEYPHYALHKEKVDVIRIDSMFRILRSRADLCNAHDNANQMKQSASRGK